MTIEELMTATEGGYSFNNYGEKSWRACLKLLRKRGLNDEQVVAVMLSKHLRWAHDMSDKAHGETTSADLGRYLLANPQQFTPEELDELTAGTA